MKRHLFMKKSDWEGSSRVEPNGRHNIMGLIACAVFLVTIWAGPAIAALPNATIQYQPMSADGLSAGYPFESWVVFNMSSNPAVAGLALPPGATFRFTFPSAFVPQTDQAPKAVLLYNWPQKPAPVPFSVALDPKDARTIILKLDGSMPAEPPERPGLKSIHIQWGPLNPKQSGDYTIHIQLTDAGPLSGSTEAIAHIIPRPVPNIAAYNQLHQGRNENWQHVKAGQTAPLPIDLLVTLPDASRSFISLRTIEGGDLDILGDGKPIGKITRRGVPVVLKPEPFGPGFARLGIVRFHITGGSTPGNAEIFAQLQGGTGYTITVVVEPRE